MNLAGGSWGGLDLQFEVVVRGEFVEQRPGCKVPSAWRKAVAFEISHTRTPESDGGETLSQSLTRVPTLHEACGTAPDWCGGNTRQASGEPEPGGDAGRHSDPRSFQFIIIHLLPALGSKYLGFLLLKSAVSNEKRCYADKI